MNRESAREVHNPREGEVNRRATERRLRKLAARELVGESRASIREWARYSARRAVRFGDHVPLWHDPGEQIAWGLRLRAESAPMFRGRGE